ncbi:MAG: CRISPR-associated protein Cas4 [Methermicoccaceae archaeon]
MERECWLQVSDITQFFYCPRKVYFRRVLGIEIAPRAKMELGKQEHEREYDRADERKGVYGIDREDVERVSQDVKVESCELGLYGRIDTVVFLKSGEVVPVEIKYTHTPRVSINWRKQIVAYALLLDHAHNKYVRRGVFYFQAQKRSVWVDITHEDKVTLMKDIERIREVMQSEKMPVVKKGKQCSYCEMAKFCPE